MSLLDAVTSARAGRDKAREELRRAIVAAHEGGESLRSIGRAADMSFTAVRGYLLRHKERGEQ